MFGFLGGFQTKIFLVVGVALLAVIGVQYLLYKQQEAKIENLTKETAILHSVKEEQDKTIRILQESFKLMAEATAKLGDRFSEIEKERSTASRVLQRHDLNKIIDEKPKLFENIINKALMQELDKARSLTDPKSYENKPNENK